MKKGALCLLFMLISVVYAEWLPIQTLETSQEWLAMPTIQIDGKGNAIAVWHRDENKGVCACIFDSASRKWGSVLPLSQGDSTKKRVNASVEMDSSGNALVVWDGDYIEAVYFNKATNQWSEPKKIAKSAEHRVPKVGFFPNGNGMLVWFEAESRSIQASLFNASNAMWSNPVKIAEKVVLPVAHNFEFKTDKWGNACAVWAEGDKDFPSVKAAYYFKDSSAWSSVFDVVQTSVYGLGIYFKPNENPVIVWSKGAAEEVFATEFHSKTLNKIERNIISFGLGPKVAANASSLAVSSIFVDVLTFEGGVTVQKHNQKFDEGNMLRLKGFVFFHSVGMDDAGNVIAAWNERTDDSNIERFSFYDSGKKNWSIPKELSRCAKDSQMLGMTSVAMHPSGHGAIVWDDALDGNHVIKAVIYRP
ncbi:MAG: hypothetical protein JSR58_04535 [Verrucomicrobia bacterium]|nr:hypothetical protein [Verrucomicrobiota bacterium]